MSPDPFPDLRPDLRIIDAFDGAQELGHDCLEPGEPRFRAPVRHYFFDEESNTYLGFFLGDRVNLSRACEAIVFTAFPVTIYTLEDDRVMRVTLFDGYRLGLPRWERRG